MDAAVLLVADADSVGVALKTLRAGTVATVAGSEVQVQDSVPKGHKVALREHQVGDPVVKFGYPIGVATAPIAAGGHVHSHNLSTVGGRREEASQEDQPSATREVQPEGTSIQSRPEQRSDPGIRSKVVVLPSVSCANIVCEQLGKADQALTVLPHQHGCGHLGDDLTLVQTTLAALASHPNVSKAIIVALGCEANDAKDLIRIARQRGGDVSLVGIQAAGGVDAARTGAEAIVEDTRSTPRSSPPVDPEGIRIGVMADRSARLKLPSLVEEVAEAARAEGFRTATVEDLDPVPRTNTGERLSVPDLWRTQARDSSKALDMISRPNDDPDIVVPVGDDDVMRLTALTALGSQLIVFITGRGNLIGSPLAPTIKVSADPVLDGLSDVIDVPADPPSLVARTLEAVHETILGRETAAEKLGMHDLDLWRISPFY